MSDDRIEQVREYLRCGVVSRSDGQMLLDEIDRLRAQRDEYGMAAFGCWVCAGEGSPDCTCEPEDPQTLDDLMGDDAPRIRELAKAHEALRETLHALVVSYPVAARLDRQVHAVVDAQRRINAIHEEAS